MGIRLQTKEAMQVSAPYAKKLVLTNCDVKTLKFVKNFPNLQCLYLEGTNITDESLENVKYLPMLRDLKLSETTISDAGLKYVTAARSLEYVIVHGTRVTKAGAERISQQMPLTAVAPTVPRRIVRMLQVLNRLRNRKMLRSDRAIDQNYRYRRTCSRSGRTPNSAISTASARPLKHICIDRTASTFIKAQLLSLAQAKTTSMC
ncbi:hypothetical protein KF707_03190 [Candidatus Obscuribacterales bacterium]|nr:hypothetical protein [Candidatus Obscuribacterales bacterium]